MSLIPDRPQPATNTPSLPTEPSARTYTLAALIGMVREGRVRVPHFQRSLRWNTSDAVALMDSVLRGYPIGSLLLWKRRGPAERVTLGRVHIDAPEMEEALYVVDGQQRLTAFVNAFDPHAGSDGPFALVYDVRERPFKVRARRPADHDAIPLSVLFDLGALLRWTREHPQYLDQIDEINEATTRLREFHVPAYEVRSADDQALRHIYDRMNNAGKRLSRAEAFWGLFAPDEEQADDLMSFATLQDHVDVALQWGRIDDDTILRLFLARRGPDVTRDIHLEFDDDRRPGIDFPGESREEAHRRALNALESAVTFLRDDAGVPHFTFLAYRYLLAVLVRFFSLFPDPDPRNRELLKRWYWRAALVGPSVVRGSATGAMRTLAGCIRMHDESGSVQDLLDVVAKAHPFWPDPNRFRANHAAGHMMLCALWSLEPRSPDDREPFTYEDLAARIESASSPNGACPEVYPRASLPANLRQSIGNRVIMPGIPPELVRRALGQGDLFHSPDPLVRASHLFEVAATEPGAVVRERTEAFGLVCVAFLHRMTGEGFDDTPPLEHLDLDADEFETDEDDDGDGQW